jgi:tellurite resistance protein
MRGLIEGVELNRSQRRALLAMCCEVARADGNVHALEYEQLLELLGRLSEGAVGFSELERWISTGPPAIELRLPEDVVKTFLREAVSIARADGKVDDAELATMKELVQRYFDITHVA